MTDAVKKNGITFGIIIAVYFVLRVSIMYAIDISLFANGWISAIDFVVCLTLSIVAISKAKSAMGGFISFKEAFTVYFLNVLIGMTVYTLFIIILFNIIDPAAKETVNELVVTKTIEGMQSFGVDSATLKKTAEDLRAKDSFSVANQLLGLPIGLAISSVIGLIVAAAMKKNKDLY